MDAHEAALTLCTAVSAGVFLIAIAARLAIPSIAVLLFAGIILGPEGLGWVKPETLGGGLETVVTLTVAIILFEGGLTLDVAGFWREPKVIVRMLTLGVLITWLGTAAIVHLVYPDVGFQLAIITGSLVIVTGPTVISPLLRRIQLQTKLHHILYWEGVWVDAVGVFIAVLCFEWIVSSSNAPFLVPLGRLVFRFVVGGSIGLATGLCAGMALRRGWVGQEHANIVVVATALLTLGLANAVLVESGILAVIVAGLVVNLHHAQQLKQLRRFELELTEVGIGVLFILLAARLDLTKFIETGGKLVLVLLVILLILRPINIMMATMGQSFKWRERAFLAWVAPRGIVAASMASLFTLRLEKLGHPKASLLETVTYAVIGTTVFLQGLTAPFLARILGLKRKSRGVWLLIGDPWLGVELHRRLRQVGGRSLVFTTDQRDARALLELDVHAVTCDPLHPPSIRDPRIADAEAVLALDPKMNDQICEAWSEVLGPASCYRWDGPNRASSKMGRSLFQDLPSPEKIRACIESGTHALDTIDVGSPLDCERFGPDLRPILAVDEERIVAIDEYQPPDVTSVVVLRRRIKGLEGLIRDAVVIDQRKRSFTIVIDELLNLAARSMRNLDKPQHRHDILSRENLHTTAVGGGIAIPHVYDQNCTRCTVYAANVVGGIDDDNLAREPIRLVFLLISPPDQAPEHLMSLSAIAQMARNPAQMRVLMNQPTTGRFLTMLREYE